MTTRSEQVGQLAKSIIEQIALKALLSKAEREGVRLCPKEIRRETINSAKTLEVTVAEMAEFQKVLLTHVYDIVMVELNLLIHGDNK